MKRQRMSPRAAAVVLAGLSVQPVFATERHWNVTSGSWGISGNWNPTGVPTSADTAVLDYFNFTTGTPGFAVVATNVGTPDTVRILGDNTVRIGTNGVLGSVNDIIVGADSTSGTLNVTNTNPFQGYFGRLNVGRELLIGHTSGPGVVNQNDGTVTMGEFGRVVVGSSRAGEFPGVGTYNLSGGLLDVPWVVVGRNSVNGHFNVGGTGSAQIDYLQIGTPSPTLTFGTVNQGGGSVNVVQTDVLAGSVYNLNFGSHRDTFRTNVEQGTFNYIDGSFYSEHLIVRFGSRVQLSGSSQKVLEVNNLFVEDSVIDLNRDSMVHHAGGNLVRSLIASGRNGGLWNGSGISSSAAAFDGAHITSLGYAVASDLFGGSGGVFEGVTVGPNAVVAKYTYYGDTDLNGIVDFDDYSRTDNGFNNGRTGWFNGDFDYNGVIDFDDYSLIDLAFNTQTGALRPIPEPSVASLVGLSMLIRRRRVRRVKSSRAASHR